jgi:hypothetical protein
MLDVKMSDILFLTKHLLSIVLILGCIVFFYWLLRERIYKISSYIQTKIKTLNQDSLALIFLFFCIFNGVFFGISMSLMYLGFLFEQFFLIVYTAHSFIYAYTLILSQLFVSIFFIYKYGILATFLSIFDLLEVVIFHVLLIQSKISQYYIHSRFILNIVFNLVVFIFFYNTHDFSLPEQLQDYVNNIVISASREQSIYHKIYYFFSLKYSDIHMFNFFDILSKLEYYFDIILVRNWMYSFRAVSALTLGRFHTGNLIDNEMSKFYYIGMSLTALLLAAAIQFKLFFLTVLSIFMLINFLSMFTSAGLIFFRRSMNIGAILMILVALRIFGLEIVILIFFLTGVLNPVFKFF